MNKDITTKNIGSFEMNSGIALISDPCYSKGTWCSGGVNKVRRGTWNSQTIMSDERDWGYRVAVLLAEHETQSNSMDTDDWETLDIDVGVDSGQCGIYDEEHFHGGEDDYGDDGWYDKCCNITNNEKDRTIQGGVIEGGVVSSSGYGDGSYKARVRRNKSGQVVAIMIDYGLLETEEETEEKYWR